MQARNIRNALIDATKGFAIILVVLGHSIQSFVTNFDDNFIFRIIYSFHMPLFMFLSGYVATIGNAESLKRKFNRLVIPFISWYFASYFLTQAYKSIGFQEYIIRWLKSPDYGLWFLWVLFLCHCTLFLSSRFNKHIGNYSIIAVYILICSLSIGILGMGLLKWHFMFFASGYLFSIYKNSLKKFKRIVMIAAVILYPILVMYWYRTQEPYFLSIFSDYLKAYHIQGMNLIMSLFKYAYKYAVPFLGIIIVFSCMSILSPNSMFFKGLSKLGLYSLDIYVLHTYLLSMTFGNGYIKIISAVLIALGSSLIISYLLRRSPLLNHIFLGGRSSDSVAVLKT